MKLVENTIYLLLSTPEIRDGFYGFHEFVLIKSVYPNYVIYLSLLTNKHHTHHYYNSNELEFIQC